MQPLEVAWTGLHVVVQSDSLPTGNVFLTQALTCRYRCSGHWKWNQMRGGYMSCYKTMLKDHPYLNISFFLLPNYDQYATPVFTFRLCSCSVKFCFPPRRRQEPLPINGEGFLFCSCYYPCSHCRSSNCHPERYVNLDRIHPDAFLTNGDPQTLSRTRLLLSITLHGPSMARIPSPGMLPSSPLLKPMPTNASSSTGPKSI